MSHRLTSICCSSSIQRKTVQYASVKYLLRLSFFVKVWFSLWKTNHKKYFLSSLVRRFSLKFLLICRYSVLYFGRKKKLSKPKSVGKINVSRDRQPWTLLVQHCFFLWFYWFTHKNKMCRMCRTLRHIKVRQEVLVATHSEHVVRIHPSVRFLFYF